MPAAAVQGRTRPPPWRGEAGRPEVRAGRGPGRRPPLSAAPARAGGRGDARGCHRGKGGPWPRCAVRGRGGGAPIPERLRRRERPRWVGTGGRRRSQYRAGAEVRKHPRPCSGPGSRETHGGCRPPQEVRCRPGLGTASCPAPPGACPAACGKPARSVEVSRKGALLSRYVGITPWCSGFRQEAESFSSLAGWKWCSCLPGRVS